MTIKPEQEKTEEETGQGDSTKYVRYGIMIFIAVTGVCLAVYCKVKDPNLIDLLGVGFSGLAFGGVILTVLMQKEELELQRREMILTREEFKTQNRTFSRQRFENTFFQLLQKQTEITRNIILRDNGGTGIAAFKNIFDLFEGEVGNYIIQAMNQTGMRPDANRRDQIKHFELEAVVIKTRFKGMIDRYKNDLLHYYAHLKVMLEFVLHTKADVDKSRYVGFIRAQMSLYETLCLYYYGATDYGLKNKVKELLIESEILDGVDETLFVNQGDNTLYSKEKL